MKAEIITIGDEILSGRTIDTNSAYISQKLLEVGVECLYQTTVGDDYERIASTISIALQRTDLIVMTGGLGPTVDDVTRKALSIAFNRQFSLDNSILEDIKGKFNRRGIEMPSSNISQAMILDGSIALKNLYGTAPGMMIEENGKLIFVFPGVPKEVEFMVSTYLLPEIKKRFTETFVISKTIKTIGIAESVLEEKIVDIIKELPENTKIAFLPGFCGVDLRITGKFKDESEGLQIIYNIEEKINHLLGKSIYGTDDDTMERVVARLLMERNKTLSVAESCTGGLVCHLLTEVSGSSNYFNRGIITYSNESKWEILGLPPHIIEEHGAVSPETAVMMANNVRKIGKTDIGLSITGIAGPTGGTKEKPVGLVYIGLSTGEDENIWKKFLFSGDRSTVKLRSAYNALNIVREYLI